MRFARWENVEKRSFKFVSYNYYCYYLRQLLHLIIRTYTRFISNKKRRRGFHFKFNKNSHTFFYNVFVLCWLFFFRLFSDHLYIIHKLVYISQWCYSRCWASCFQQYLFQIYVFEIKILYYFSCRRWSGMKVFKSLIYVYNIC